MRRVSIVVLVVCTSLSFGRAQLSAGQAPAHQPSFRTGIALVEVSAVVSDADGKPLAGLTAADFDVFEDGEARRIVSVRHLTGGMPRPAAAARAAVAAMPSTRGTTEERISTNTGVADAPAFVLLLDDLNTSGYKVHRVIRAALGALGAVPHDGLVAVATTSGIGGTLLTLAPPGPEHTQQIEAVRGQLLLFGSVKLSGASTTPSRVGAPCGVGSAVVNSQDCGDPTRAVRRVNTVAAIARMLKQAGSRRKAVFWFTEDMGVTPLNPAEARAAQRAALQDVLGADVAIYPVDPRELPPAQEEDTPDKRSGGVLKIGDGEGIKLQTDDMAAVTLHQLAQESGGRWITNVNDHERVLADVVRLNSAAYLLAYESPVSHVAGRHRIDVRVRRPGTRVDARRGYVVPSAQTTRTATGPTGAETSPALRLLQETLMGSVPQGRLPLRVHVAPQFAVGKTGRALVTVQLDPAGQDAPLTLGLLSVDEDGAVSNEQTVHVAPVGGSVPLEVSADLTLTRGAHQLRVAAVTEDGTRTGLVLVPVEIVEPGRDVRLAPPVLLGTTDGRVHPTARRDFVVGAPLGLQVELAGRPVARKGVSVRVVVRRADGTPLQETDAVLDAGSAPGIARATAIVPVAGLAPGAYTLAVEARVEGRREIVTRLVPVTLEAALPAVTLPD